MSLVEVKPGEIFEAEMPYSEVCMYMKVAGKRMGVKVITARERKAAQLYNLDGQPFSFPVTLGEVGVYERDGKYFVEER
jgi:hypothetical protein